MEEHRRHDLVDGGKLALAHIPAGKAAGIRAHHDDATVLEGLDVGLRGGVLPHVHVHGRCHHEGPLAGEQRGGHDVVRDALRHLGDDIGRGRNHEREVCPLGELDVRDGGLGVIEEVECHAVPGEGLEGGGANEPGGLARHGHANLAAPLLETAEDLACLIRGNAPAHKQRDARRALGIGAKRSHSPLRLLGNDEDALAVRAGRDLGGTAADIGKRARL